MFDLCNGNAEKRPFPENVDVRPDCKRHRMNCQASDSCDASASFAASPFIQHSPYVAPAPVLPGGCEYAESNGSESSQSGERISCQKVPSHSQYASKAPAHDDSTNVSPWLCSTWKDSVEDLEGDIFRDDDDPISRNACFGVVTVDIFAKCEKMQKNQRIPMDLKTFGTMVKLVSEDDQKYAGLIRLPVIRQLLEDESICMTATLRTSDSDAPKSLAKCNSKSAHNCTASIVICGARNERFRVGKLLSDSGLFLQHPSTEECSDLEYLNPHYLLRPGAHMPLPTSSSNSYAGHGIATGLLNEVEKNRIMQIFDQATEEGLVNPFPQVLHSKRLKSTLKDHQITALSMMTEKEMVPVGNHRFPSMWENSIYSDSTKRFRNKVTGQVSASMAVPTGGLLADDMGLGKTLSIISLICLSLDRQVNGEVPQVTLIIAPKSTLPGWQLEVDKHVHHNELRMATYHGGNRKPLHDMLKSNDVILTTYETMRADWNSKGPLFETEWYRIVLDEAHHIRNRSSQAFQAVCSMRAIYRWCLTGTPIQNTLGDYGALLSFIRVQGFTDKATFDAWITKPIKEKKSDGLRKLQILVKATCLRRTKQSIGYAFDLPSRTEKVEHVKLHQDDQEMYDFFKARTAAMATGLSAHSIATAHVKGSQDSNILTSLNCLRLICNHGKQLLPCSAIEIWESRDRTMTDVDDALRDSRVETPAFSSKIDALIKNLKSAQRITSYQHQHQHIPAKSVVFSYWTKMLDIVQQALAMQGFGFCRIDGNSSLEERRAALKTFNSDPNCTVMLASIGSAGEGLNLTVASHVHLLEPHWNPMAEAQAVDRVYRIGQVREVFITRYIVPNSIETYIQWIQQQKLKLASQFFDTEDTTQAEIDMERWTQLRISLGCSA